MIRYIVYTPKVRVLVEHSAILLVVKERAAIQVRTIPIYLSMYPFKWVQGVLMSSQYLYGIQGVDAIAAGAANIGI